MTSKIVVNNIESDAGVSTVFFNSDIGGTGGTLNVDGNLNVDGVLSYEDVTNIDSVGIVTARDGIHVTGGSVAIGTDTGETNFLTTINGDLSLGEKNGVDNTFIDQKQNGSLEIINSGRTANSGSVRINRCNNISGDTTYFRDFVVYDGKETALLTVDGSTSNIGIGTDNPGTKLEIHSNTIPRINSVYQGSKHFGMSVGGSGGGFVITDGHFTTVNHQPYADRGTDNNLTERLRITSGGDVLIADTTNAIYDDSTGGGMNLKANGQLVLKKQATSTADPLMWLNDTGQTTNKFILFAQDGNEKASIGLAGNDLRFARDGYNETLRIDSNGNIGINKAPETDWNNSYRAIEIGNSSVSAYQGSSYPSIELNMNCRGTQASYGAGWKYILGMRATQIHMPYSGETLFRRANSGSADGAISWNESMRISNDGSLYHRGNNSSTVNNTDGDSQGSSGYPAGGATFNKNVSVNNGTSDFGQCMSMLSHTKSLNLDGSTNHDMITIWNREGCFVGHIYVGYSTGGDGAVAIYKFSTFYSVNSVTAELGPSSRSSDTVSVNISSIGDSHTIRVNGNGYNGNVTVGVVFLSAGRTDSDHYGVRYW